MVVVYSPHGSHKYMKVPCDCKYETELESCDPNFQVHIDFQGRRYHLDGTLRESHPRMAKIGEAYMVPVTSQIP